MRRLTVLAIASLALSACADRSPTAARVPPPQTHGGTLVTAFDCTVTVQSRQARCVQARPTGGARTDIILGTPYVQLASQNVAYNSGTGRLTFDVAVTNKISQPIGTTDGSSAASPGIRVFFVSGPSVTSGTGTIAAVPDGFASFTAAGQAYYEYGQVLASNVRSSYHTWTFVAPPTVLTYAFSVYVSVPVQFPNGWITVSPADSYLFVDYLQVLEATAYNAFGQEATGVTFTWSVDDTDVATVSSGLVHAVGAGLATVTVTDGGARSGTALIHVE